MESCVHDENVLVKYTKRRSAMGIGNIGYAGILVSLLPLIMLILWVSVIVAIFQIRNETRRTSEKLEEIYKLLLEYKSTH